MNLPPRPVEFLVDRILEPVFARTDLRDRLAGRGLTVEIIDLDWSILLVFHHLGVRLEPSSGRRGDLILRGTLGDFMARIRGRAEPTLQFEGDLGFAQTLDELIRHLPRERGSWFRAILGDPPGDWLSRTLDRSESIFRKNGARLARLARSGLERAGFGVGPERFSLWQSELRQLAAHLEALEGSARIHRPGGPSIP
jgi:ubiquinone biosynthesis protein UbiJ